MREGRKDKKKEKERKKERKKTIFKIYFYIGGLEKVRGKLIATYKFLYMLFGLIFKTRVVLYENGDEVVSMNFNASGTNNVNWFSQARLISSLWNDLKTSNGLQHFDIVGSWSRFFEVSGPYTTCQNDSGWMIITGGSCEWETRVDVPGIQYSKLANNVSWNDCGKNH